MSETARSRPPRVYVPDLAEQRGKSEENGEISLKGEERDHVRSRRLRVGDEVVAFDGKGARAPAVLARGGAAITLLPSKQFFSSSSSFSSAPRFALPGEPANHVTVALACAEPARIEWAIEKGTECGAAGFVLLDAERSQRSHVAALSSPARLDRLRRIAVEAAKQCDRTIVPFVEGPKRPEDFLRMERGEARLLVLDAGGEPIASYAPEAPSPSRVNSLRSNSTRVRREGPGPLLGVPRDSMVSIGPEGGFSPSELLLFIENSGLLLSLGSRILRLETAVVVALAKLVDPA